MNSEELEQSLRTEFESYLKNVHAEMRQDVTEFQTKIEAEFDKHRAQTAEAFQGFAARFDSNKEFDQGFSQLVAEHLKLARDEGAKLSAMAYAEAEKLASENDVAPAQVPANYAGLRDAIADITSKDSQSAILKTLVEHASEFAPRGAFFIIKNDHIAGWKVFGEEAGDDDAAVREIHFPTAADTILGKASNSKSTAEGSNGATSEDARFLEPLGFGSPEQMFAIPLVARGRGVAVMYADQGSQGASVNIEALQTLVSIAGLTVELLALSQSAKAEDRDMPTADLEDSYTAPAKLEAASPFAETVAEVEPVEVSEPQDFTFSDSDSVQGGFPTEVVVEKPVFESYETVETVEAFEPAEVYEPVAVAPHVEEVVVPEPAPAYVAENVQPEPEPVAAFESNSGEMVFDSGGSIESARTGLSPFESAVEPFAPAGMIGGSGVSQAIEPVSEVVTPAVPQARLSDRNVDLPIEVPEDERRLHNDARRFARLLVSEIKLYNEKKVLEGRQSHDLYERLREAIDRSREMYDKRVQPPVAARFDYFHYELLNALAEGDAARFGAGYTGASV